jgi:ubiquinone/menaquinone biosynthesis C-methylase UbiE
MSSDNKLVEQHYSREYIFETITHELEKAGIDLQHITRKDIAGIDEFHVRGKEVTLEMAAAAGLQPGLSILDVGCGIGGPCRLFADEYDCIATGIDITSEYVRTAEQLSKLTKLNDRTRFIHGSALDLPFTGESFDIVWTQHVQMNIADKKQFYAEIKRVMRKDGRFIYYDIFSNNHQPIHFPVPWAAEESISHLVTIPELHSILREAGFTQPDTRDQTQQGTQFFKKMFEQTEKTGPPKAGISVLIGEGAPERLKNLYHNLAEELIVLESGICRKT